MRRTLAVLAALAALLVVLVLTGSLLWYFAYGMQAGVPAAATVPGLQGEARIDWHESGLVTVRASGEADRLAALGYVHGRRHAWPLTLWRRAAEGRLAEAFGTDLLPADRLARHLGLAVAARVAYRRLPDEDRTLLQAYTAGLNTALAERGVQGLDPFVLLETEPETWQPWHPLAVEHLFAWLAVPPGALADTSGSAPPAADSLRRADRLLRHTLHLFGFDHSVAWTAPAEGGTALVRRLVYGDAALPALQEIALASADTSRADVVGATLPGTPFFLTGQTPGRAWTLLPASPAALVRVPATLFTDPPTHERLVDADGDEHLVTRRRAGDLLALEPIAPPDTTARLVLDTTATAPPDTAALPADSVLALRWIGLQPVTDWAAWRALPTGAPSRFSLQRGDGLVVEDGAARVTGAPEVVARHAAGLVVGNTAWTRSLARRLDTLAADTASTPADWLDDCVSPWAADVAPTLLAAVDTVALDTTTRAFDEAVVYLRNWDHAYDQASIGASVFEAWAVQHHRRRGHRPAPLAPPDTSRLESLLRVRLLQRAVDSLAARYGDDLSTWRWERVHHVRLAFPLWPADSLAPDRPAAARFAPIERPGRGHPSTLCGGTTPADDAPAAPAHWQGLATPNAPLRLRATHTAHRLDRFLDRYRIPRRPPDSRTLDPGAPPEHVTTLRPADG